ncbi:hypothetical protein KIM372_13520 [Bombiscardovia nodaiensis]|uniref:Uncharacterized protein n=1 Tax=Bombiscardovia nodaiensis TaxID=2932181 RepID=A0ABM8B976_9BIFI|nr:hypothetical protein KIM372_13520 [Bombiscardovia nodaiensis]
MKVAARVLSTGILLLSIGGLALVAFLQIRGGTFADEHPDLFTVFDSGQQGFLWIGFLLFALQALLSLALCVMSFARR